MIRPTNNQRFYLFSVYHPSVLFVYFGVVIVLTMASIHPVVAVLSLLLGIVNLATVDGVTKTLKKVFWLALVIAVVAVINGFINPLGETIVAQVGAWTITFEALVFGATSGAILVSLLVWLLVASRFMTTDDVLALMSNRAPALSLMSSMIMRLVPDFVKRMRSAHQARRALAPEAPVVRTRVQGAIDTSSVLVSWAMEDSFDTADSMTARGYGSPNRTTFRAVSLKKRDKALFAVILVLTILITVSYFKKFVSYSFYPALDSVGNIVHYLPLIVLLALPLIENVRGWLLWNR